MPQALPAFRGRQDPRALQDRQEQWVSRDRLGLLVQPGRRASRASSDLPALLALSALLARRVSRDRLGLLVLPAHRVFRDRLGLPALPEPPEQPELPGLPE